MRFVDTGSIDEYHLHSVFRCGGLIALAKEGVYHIIGFSLFGPLIHSGIYTADVVSGSLGFICSNCYFFSEYGV